MIHMFEPFISEESVEGAVACLRSRWIGEGQTVYDFERRLGEEFGFRWPLFLSSGTAGLRLALAMAGVGPGDEVITTAMTCTATNTPILEQFARPVFADIQFLTGNIDPQDIMHRITEKTKAILVVHWAGYPCDMEAVDYVADRACLPVIEDAAHALGATYHGQPIGEISEYTMFSFQAIKQLTTVDGGLLTLESEEAWLSARERRWFGIDRVRRTKSEEWPGYYDWPQSVVGYKYQPTNLTAAIGLGNLEHYRAIAAQRQAIVDLYRRELAGVPGVTLFEAADDRTSGNWLFTMHVERRKDFHAALLARGVESSVCHIRNDLHPIFGPIRSDLPVLDEYVKSYISIPLHSNMGLEDAWAVVNAVKAGW